MSVYPVIEAGIGSTRFTNSVWPTPKIAYTLI